ncbi:hypothetical protein N310_12169, partial [Acanthisitta chloris]
RAATDMWKLIASSGRTLEKVLPTLLRVLEDWPVRSMSTSDGDKKDIFALAVIVRKPESQEALMPYSHRLIVALLFQVCFCTKQMSEEVNAFWRRCQEDHHL